jgi:hypothetical protein
MSIASKGACLALAWLQLASPALAQSAPTPPAQGEPLPPEPVAATTPPAAAPDYQLRPQAYPLSAQILQINLAPLEFTRAGVGVAIPDLLPAVAGSPRAEALVREGLDQLHAGGAWFISGLVLSLGTLVPAVVVLASNNHLSDDQTALVTGLLIGSLVGLVLQVVGGGIASRGTHNLTQGVNAYNQDLLDGRLVPPAVTATPPR